MSRNRSVLEWDQDVELEEWERCTAPLIETSNVYGLPAAAAMNAKRSQVLGLVLLMLIVGSLVYIQTVYSQNADGETANLHAREYEEVVASKASIQALEATAIQEQDAGDRVVSLGTMQDFGESSSVAIQQIALRDDLAFVKVSASKPAPLGYEFHYQQTIIYQQHKDGWVPLSPTEAAWEPHQEVETRYFRVRYRWLDATAVTQMAPMLDVMYETLQAHYGRALDTAKITIQIDEQGLLFQGYRLWNVQEPIRLLSPALRKLPLQDSHVDVLATQIAGIVGKRFLQEAQEQHPPDETWRPWIDALHEWQVEQYSLTFIDWRQEVIRWLVTSIPSQIHPGGADRKTIEALQADIVRLCAAYREQVHISSLHALDWRTACRFPERAALQYSILYLPVTLEQTGDPHMILEYPPRTRMEIASISTFMRASLLDYLVAVYGREALHELFAGFGEHESWETLAPALFGISAKALEAEWQEYLLQGGCRETGGSYDCQLPEVPVQ